MKHKQKGLPSLKGGWVAAQSNNNGIPLPFCAAEFGPREEAAENSEKKSLVLPLLLRDVPLILLAPKAETLKITREAMAICVSGSHTLFVNRSNLKTVAVLSREKKMRVQYDLKQGQSRNFHELPSGLSMEVIVQKGAKKNTNFEYPPLVFVHGSYHAAWCWAEHWLPFFSSSGHDCYAISLLGQGESDSPPDSVAEDLYPKLKGAVLVCSVPPSGNSGIVWRYIFSKPIVAFKVTRSLAAKAFQTSLSLCRETFFSATMEDHVVRRYQELMKESSRMPLFDLRKLNASLPVPSVPNCPFEILVLGAKDDFIVDAEGLKETAKFYGVPPVCVDAIAHDMMLDVSWEKGAEVIFSWLNGSEKCSKLQGR
ncbi:hypothetical protein JHK84_051834 [Glycine max]|nr:hypothetical protein JHK84_051834 [Glycine max]